MTFLDGQVRRDLVTGLGIVGAFWGSRLHCGGKTRAMWLCLLSNVGTMHCGVVPSSSGAVFSKSDFLKFASEVSEG